VLLAHSWEANTTADVSFLCTIQHTADGGFFNPAGIVRASGEAKIKSR
jgi:hypothetical protein